MKNCILTLLLSVPALTGFAQNTDGSVPGIKQEMLSKYSNVQELIPVAYRYLTNWSKTINYESVQIVASNNGKQLTLENRGGQFTKEQKQLLNNADVGSEIIFYIKYSHLTASGDKSGGPARTYDIDLKIKALPAVSATCPGGIEKLAEYLRGKV